MPTARRQACLTILGASAAVVPAAAGPPGTFYTFETRNDTSALTAYSTTCAIVDQFPAVEQTIIDAMAYDPSTDTLFGFSGFSDTLYTVDRTTGELTAVGPNLLFITGLAIHPTTFDLYAITLHSDLYILDKSNAQEQFIGSDPNGFDAAHGLAFGDDGTLYASETIGNCFSTLGTVDLTDGEITTVGTMPFDFVVSLDCGPDGLLYGSDNGTDSIIFIDPSDAFAGLVCTYANPSFSHTSLVLIGAEPEDPCSSDIDFDGTVGTSDLLDLLSAWGPCETCCLEDLDGNGFVSTSDLLELLSEWGPCP
ncbi:MAG: hypothetical protein ACYS0D_11090 [Planctomycetota bacterium]|jgi:hypothetical protein